MCTAVQHYATFQDVLDAHANGWYFAESSSMQSVDDNMRQGNDSCTLIPEHSFSKLENKECQASDDFKKEVHIPRKRQRLEISTNILIDGERKLNFNIVNAYMKNYKSAKKAKETESEKLSRQEKEKEYMRTYRRRIKDNETEEEKRARLKKQNVQIRKCRQKRRDDKLDEIKPVRKFTTWQIVDKPLHNVDKETYLSQFDSIRSGPIHVQKWAIKNMQDFHNSLKLKIYMCEVCHEAWPLSSKGKKKSPYICSRCSRDKNGVKKFSSQNGMTPSQVPNELQGLTQLEEMLIAHVFPVLSVYTKPGGQKAYKGHCINVSQDIQELANSLPRYPSELPVVVVSVKGKDNTYKDLTVRREKVSCALH